MGLAPQPSGVHIRVHRPGGRRVDRDPARQPFRDGPADPPAAACHQCRLAAGRTHGSPPPRSVRGCPRMYAEVVAEYGRLYGGFLTRAVAEEPTARRGVERALREAAAEYTLPGRPRGCLVISAALNISPASAEVADSLREMRLSNVRGIADAIRADIAAGELPPDTDAGALAAHTGAVIQGMSQQARDGAERTELEAIAELALKAWPRRTGGEAR
ncbi:TetR family transcriptional regulator C-terminal domain-containing protein [Streptomyces tubercidicus]|uniref:TetR family transcriptional regulator C-terminal domain-containing protein n=1 Tax=Streptomyces tubercidicus TaxID=47759 RepID=UPI0037AD6EAF